MNNPTGFSFTTLFFGPLPVLFRGNWKLAALLLGVFLFTFVPVAGWASFPLMFIAPAVVNRLHATGTFNPFPMLADEIKHSLIYFGVWLLVVALATATLGMTWLDAIGGL